MTGTAPDVLVRRAVGLYVASYLMIVAVVVAMGLEAQHRYDLIFIAVVGGVIVLLLGAVVLAISRQLLRRSRFARWWLIVFAGVPLLSMYGLTPWRDMEWSDVLDVISGLLRLGAGAVMLMPSVARWFATPPAPPGPLASP